MDKRIERSNRLGVLKIKTDITLYRCIAIVLSILSIICGVLYLTNNYNWLVVIISFLIGVGLLLMTIFMGKIVDILNLPSYSSKETKFFIINGYIHFQLYALNIKWKLD